MGYTAPDPKEDLYGQDVARKLVILARELDYPAELEQVDIENLIPETLRNSKKTEAIIKESSVLDSHYQAIKETLGKGQVLRYIAELDITRQKMTVKLKVVDKDSAIGQLNNADILFEIYTENQKEQPIIIKGVGAGTEVIATAVFSDLLRVGANS